MERVKKIELIQRSLALRHKIKVHESMESPTTHEDLAVFLLSKWDLEDELRAIEELLADTRTQGTREKRAMIEKNILANVPVKTRPGAKVSKKKSTKKKK